ncbi:hypothetical protein R6Q59_004623 [Mikania micrantha]|uniref:Uncharacterized protein n=1 Tax=Mikania micrantha TaxID=192012 RepID=A0A5N6MNT5_9ASTR|nr:hypothetical protein E3N88_31225 [Mikania micrantha]
MKKPGLLAASMAAASATTAVTGSGFKSQDHGTPGKRIEDSSSEKMKCCSEKFAPKFDGLRFIETLVTAHR